MPWNDKSGGGGGPWGSGGGGGGGRGPWGQGPVGGGPGGPQAPDLEDLIRRGQDRIRRLFPGGRMGGGRGLLIIFLILAGLWMLSGVYRVAQDEQGVVLRFGKYEGRTDPSGLHYHLPYPIETAVTPKVTRINQVDIGMRSGAAAGRSDIIRDVPEESLMLTGDENIVDVDFTVFWKINDAADYLFNVQNPPSTVKAVAESAMREIVGRSEIQPILTEARAKTESDVKELMQRILDDYEAGILITEVKMQKVDPPGAVIDAFRDVQAARADLERQRNEAEAYANDIVPRARGEAAQIMQQAEAFKQQTIAEATGEAQRFLEVYGEYAKAKEVTERRIYIETMERVMAGMNKLILDSESGSGVVPYLPLSELRPAQRETGSN